MLFEQLCELLRVSWEKAYRAIAKENLVTALTGLSGYLNWCARIDLTDSLFGLFIHSH